MSCYLSLLKVLKGVTESCRLLRVLLLEHLKLACSLGVKTLDLKELLKDRQHLKCEKET